MNGHIEVARVNRDGVVCHTAERSNDEIDEISVNGPDGLTAIERVTAGRR